MTFMLVTLMMSCDDYMKSLTERSSFQLSMGLRMKMAVLCCYVALL